MLQLWANKLSSLGFRDKVYKLIGKGVQLLVCLLEWRTRLRYEGLLDISQKIQLLRRLFRLFKCLDLLFFVKLLTAKKTDDPFQRFLMVLANLFFSFYYFMDSAITLKEVGLLHLHRLSAESLLEGALFLKLCGLGLQVVIRGRQMLRKYHKVIQIRNSYITLREGESVKARSRVLSLEHELGAGKLLLLSYLAETIHSYLRYKSNARLLLRLAEAASGALSAFTALGAGRD